MRRKNRLRVCAVGTILAVVAGAADRAVGYFVAIGGDVYTASADHCGPFGLSCESWFEVKPIHGGGSVRGGEVGVGDGNTSSHGSFERRRLTKMDSSAGGLTRGSAVAWPQR